MGSNPATPTIYLLEVVAKKTCHRAGAFGPNKERKDPKWCLREHKVPQKSCRLFSVCSQGASGSSPSVNAPATHKIQNPDRRACKSIVQVRHAQADAWTTNHARRGLSSLVDVKASPSLSDQKPFSLRFGVQAVIRCRCCHERSVRRSTRRTAGQIGKYKASRRRAFPPATQAIFVEFIEPIEKLVELGASHAEIAVVLIGLGVAGSKNQPLPIGSVSKFLSRARKKVNDSTSQITCFDRFDRNEHGIIDGYEGEAASSHAVSRLELRDNAQTESVGATDPSASSSFPTKLLRVLISVATYFASPAVQSDRLRQRQTKLRRPIPKASKALFTASSVGAPPLA